MMKHINRFFQQCSNPQFFPKVWEMGGVDWDSFVKHPNDYYDPSSGSVPGCIYYSDTVKFAKANHEAILIELCEFEQEYGPLNNKPLITEGTTYYNWLTWFAWEHMCSELIAFIEQ